MDIAFPTYNSPARLTENRTETEANLYNVSKELEASFLFEMLKSSGLGKGRSDFGGGAGEDQFASLLLRKQAEAMTENGGLGLAEKIFDALVAQSREHFP